MSRSRSLPTPRASAGGSGSGSAVPMPTPSGSNIPHSASARANTLPSPIAPTTTSSNSSPSRLPHHTTSLQQPSNAHIPLAMQTRPRETSDPRALLAAAATRAPGSPPQHMQTAQYPGQSMYAPASVRQRTPERHGQERRPSDPQREAALLTREGSFRAEGGAHLTREGSFRTPELALDVKRLMAKPVSVTPGRTRTDSDGESAGRAGTEGVHIRRKRYDGAGKRLEEEGRASRSEDGHGVVARRSVDGTVTRRSEDRTLEREREKKEREVALAFVGPHSGAEEKRDKDKEKQKRPKNVLKRRPSAGRPSPAPSPVGPAPAPPMVTPAIASAGPPVLSLNLSLKPMPLSFSSVADAASPQGSPREASSGQLTPAGAVVQAYKRGLDPTSPATSPLPSPSSATFKRKQASDSGHGESLAPPAAPPSPPVTPYYTVFGSTSGRVVAVGGPEDAWDGASSYISASAFPMFDSSRPRSSKAEKGPTVTPRTLSRKVSERWGRKREEPEDEVRGRATQQQGDRRRKSSGRSGSRNASPAGEPDSAMWTKSPLNDPVVFTNEPRSRRSEPALGGGSKIWKLMKRISTGALKEKYDHAPEDLEARGAMSTDGHSRDEPGVLSRFMQSRSSLSGPQAPSGIPRAAPRALPLPPPIPASHQSRASIATRSSSPVSSSDVASSKYFHKTPGSGRSSTSSYGDESTPPPPVPAVPTPNVIIGKHIVPPKDLYKLDVGEFKSSSFEDNKVHNKPMAFFGTQNIRTPDDWTIVATPAEEHPPSLPHPPRRLPVPNSSRERQYNAEHPRILHGRPHQTFAARKPPPVDKARVENVLSSLEPAASRRMSSAPDDTLGRKMSITSGTARQKRLEQRSTSLPRAEPLTFRGMSEKAAQALTEKEKADRWDDLLQRSDRAGGTIHLGHEVSLRYSVSSTQLLSGASLLGAFMFMAADCTSDF
ncbi:hypothetical protein B0H13DRAFT_1996819 [Mycena leptocephala]|nr:hypothetical protein B0H13DRAFT_1996819 [Mycena leptocephala]